MEVVSWRVSYHTVFFFSFFRFWYLTRRPILQSVRTSSHLFSASKCLSCVWLVSHAQQAKVSELWSVIISQGQGDVLLEIEMAWEYTMSWVWPPPSNSDHQDYHIFSRDPYKPSFATVTVRGPPSKLCHYFPLKNHPWSIDSIMKQQAPGGRCLRSVVRV